MALLPPPPPYSSIDHSSQSAMAMDKTALMMATSSDTIPIDAVDHFCEMVCWIWFAPETPSPSSSPYLAPTISGFSTADTTPSSSSFAHAHTATSADTSFGHRASWTGVSASPNQALPHYSSALPPPLPHPRLSPPSPLDISSALEDHLRAIGQAPATSRPLYEAHRLEPTERFRTFVHDAIASTQISPAAMAVSLLYIWRLKKMYPHLRGKNGSEYRIAVTSLMLSNKLLEDNTFTNKSWSEISHIDLRDITKMEIEFWLGLRMSIHVSVDEFTAWQSQLRNLSERRVKAIKARERDSSLRQSTLYQQSSPLPPPTFVSAREGSCATPPPALVYPSQLAQQSCGLAHMSHSPSARLSASNVPAAPPFTFSMRPDWSWSSETLSTPSVGPPPHSSSAVSSQYASPEYKLLPLPSMDSTHSRRRPSSSASQDSVASIKRAFHDMHTVDASDYGLEYDEPGPPQKRVAMTSARDDRYSPPQYALRTSVSPTVPRLRRPRQTSANGVSTYPRATTAPRFQHTHSRSLGAAPWPLPSYDTMTHRYEHSVSDGPQMLAAPFAGYDMSGGDIPQLMYYQLAAGYERIPYVMPSQPQYAYADVPLFPPTSRRPSTVSHGQSFDCHPFLHANEQYDPINAPGQHAGHGVRAFHAMPMSLQHTQYAPSPLSQGTYVAPDDHPIKPLNSMSAPYAYNVDPTHEAWHIRTGQAAYVGNEQ